jgi:hypothetical protein
VGREVNARQQGPPLSRIVVTEPAAGLGDRVAEHAGANQSLDPRDLAVRHAGVEQCLVDDVHDANRVRRHGGPGEQQGHDSRVPPAGLPGGAGDAAKPFVPRHRRIRPGQLGEEPAHQAVEQVVLALDVRVERHRGDADPGGHRPHGDRAKPLLVGDGQRRVEYLLPPVRQCSAPPLRFAAICLHCRSIHCRPQVLGSGHGRP